MTLNDLHSSTSRLLKMLGDCDHVCPPEICGVRHHLMYNRFQTLIDESFCISIIISIVKTIFDDNSGRSQCSSNMECDPSVHQIMLYFDLLN